MRYFFDTEFIEDGKTIELISIGVVSEDGREFYREVEDISWWKANQWVLDNVKPHLSGVGIPKGAVKQDLFAFVELTRGDTAPEFWAYYADYDWVCLCQLFGTMMDLPEGWPMYCNDLIQEWPYFDIACKDKVPMDGTEHNALDDARWNRKLFQYMTPGLGW